mgnify:CR=1 FL=1
MKLDDLKNISQAKGYSIDMMSELMQESAEEYLELEYDVREATKSEMVQLDRILSQADTDGK